MKERHILFHGVSFSYESSAPLFERLDCDLGPGWTGLVGENGSGKTTLLKLASGLLAPVSGKVGRPDHVLYCPQRTDFPSEAAARFLGSRDGAACRWRGLLRLESGWAGRWDTLSHGERKKAQVAAALWRDPPALALDEPANHLDLEARELLRRALAEYSGIGLIVSHDRALLDGLCRQCLFLHPPLATLRPGGFSAGWAQEKIEGETAARRRALLQEEVLRLKKESARRRELRAKKRAKPSLKRSGGKDHDARFKQNMARLSGKDAVGGRLARQLEGRLRQAEEKHAISSGWRTYDSGIWVAGAVSERRCLFALQEGVIPFGNGASLRHPRLEMGATDRIALTGPNGAGKSTLVRRIMGGLSLDPGRVIYLPQEITLADSRRLLADVFALPGEEQGRLLALVSRLGSRPPRVLATEEPSPGETRKLLIALGILSSPHLIVMDEPTNHLDVVAVQSLVEALVDCPCGMLLASHDRLFLEELTEIRWEIGARPEAGGYELAIR